MSKHDDDKCLFGHTPGPWLWLADDLVRDDGSRIVFIFAPAEPGTENDDADDLGPLTSDDLNVNTVVVAPVGPILIRPADRALIAAAPDLLAACEALLPWLAGAETAGAVPPPVAQVLAQARAAIAKARGEEER